MDIIKTLEKIEKKNPSMTDVLNLEFAYDAIDKHNLELINEFKDILTKEIQESNKFEDDYFFYFRGIEFLAPKGECYKNYDWIHVWSIHMLLWAKLLKN